MTRRAFSGAPWEAVHGYCRAVRHGNAIAVSGTTSVDRDGNVVGEGDAFAQTEQCLRIIEAALNDLDAGWDDVMRTRVYLTDADDWPDVARAHAAIFGDRPPASSMFEISRLIDPRLKVEIEVDAIVVGE